MEPRSAPRAPSRHLFLGDEVVCELCSEFGLSGRCIQLGMVREEGDTRHNEIWLLNA